MEARARRAAAAVGLAAVVVAAIGAFYLRPWQAFAPMAAPPPPPRLPAARTAAVQQLQFLTANLGWVVTGRPASSSLFRTTDGGRHWQRQLDGVAGEGWTLSFFDARRGVVYGADQRGHELWRTTDGGQRWTRMATSCLAPPSLFFYLDIDHGWCLETSSSFTPTGPVPLVPDRQGVALFRTVDGGVHWWRVLATDQARPVSGGLGDDGQKAWIWFRDAEVGWIGQRSAGGTAAVYATTDGGDHWSRQELPPPAGGWGPALATWENGPQQVSGRASPWLMVSELRAGPQQGLPILAGRYLYAWRSSTWTGPVLVPKGGPLVVEEADQAHWLVADGSSVLETTDAGENWLTLGHVPGGWVVAGLTMADRDHGWALLFSSAPPEQVLTPVTRLARTVDGGRHWTLVTTPS